MCMHAHTHTQLYNTVRTPYGENSTGCHHLIAYSLSHNFQWTLVKLLLCEAQFVGEHKQALGKLFIIYIIIYSLSESKITKVSIFREQNNISFPLRDPPLKEIYQ